MKKLALFAAAVLASLPAFSAAETPAVPEPSAYTQATVASAYNWRGQVYDDRPVIQPYAQVTSHGFSFSVWANVSLSEKNYKGHDVTEVDLTASYSLPIDVVNIVLGVIYYLPVNTDPGSVPLHEIFVTAEYPNSMVTPRVEAYRNFDPAVGYYLLAGLTREFAFGDKLTLTCDFSSGFGSSNFNRFYYEVDGNRMNDGNASVSLRYALGEAVYLTPSVRYTWLWDGKLRDASATIYPASGTDPSMFIGSLTLDYSF